MNKKSGTFNGKYTSYLGPNKTAATVESLVQTAIASNASETNSGQNRTITINTKEPSALGSKTVPRTGVYEITATYAASGLITDITVSPAPTSW